MSNLLSVIRIAGLILATLLLGCSAQPLPEIPIAGSELDRANLTGEWVGRYVSPGNQRSGRVVFRLSEDGDVAEGDVLMVPHTGVVYEPINRDRYEPPDPPEYLRVRFVRVSGSQISGALEPYRDPECGCILSTTFVGSISGNTIHGEFQSLGGSGHRTQVGSWEAHRQAAEVEPSDPPA